jgi:hypothetical protein
MSFLSRTLTSAFVDTAEPYQAIENTKLMLTERQRQMAKDALKASSDRFADLMDRAGVNLEEARRDEHAAIATIELKLRRALAPNPQHRAPWTETTSPDRICFVTPSEFFSV